MIDKKHQQRLQDIIRNLQFSCGELSIIKSDNLLDDSVVKTLDMHTISISDIVDNLEFLR